MVSLLPVCCDGDPIPASLRGAVVAIGNFDGVHRGHQHLIEAACREAARTSRAGAVLTFKPHPRAFFNPETPLFLLTPEPVKRDVLARSGIDAVFIRRFDRRLANLSAEAFVADLLVSDIGVSGVVVGHDFHFGHGREGTPERLVHLCGIHGLSCTILPAIVHGSDVVSSSAIRAALERGEVATANELLGYRWFVRAEVRHGDKRGRTLGYPTANLRLADETRLRHGIYAVRAWIDGDVRDGVASFGRRPTFDNGAPLLEVFLFDFAGDLYGRILDVEFVGWLRGEERFESIEALVAQMDRDSASARSMLAADRMPSLMV